MEIGFRDNSWHVRPDAREGGRVEWHTLQTRFAAAHAVRRAFGDSPAPHSGPEQSRGSFDAESARVIASWAHCLADVNPTASSNCKPEAGKDAAAAGIAPRGRGLS
jgi:hypothetical protein